VKPSRYTMVPWCNPAVNGITLSDTVGSSLAAASHLS
jgi:hypothetical protein